MYSFVVSVSVGVPFVPGFLIIVVSVYLQSSLASSLKTEPPTNDVEICCRFEDIATEGHQFYAKKKFAEAKDCYNALLFLVGQLKR